MTVPIRVSIFILVILCLVAFPAKAAGVGDVPGTAPVEAARENTSGNGSDTDGAAEPENGRPDRGAWESIWSGQREMIHDMRETAMKLSDSFASQTENLSQRLRPYEEEGRRLLVFTNTFKGHPNSMEAVDRRLGATITDMEHILQPLTTAREDARGLLERVNHMAASLPDDTDQSRFSDEMRGYIHDITRVRLRLTAALAQYDSILPSLTLLQRLKEVRKKLSASLPELWKDYYLQKPLPWLSPDTWINTGTELSYTWEALLLRLPVEFPSTIAQWGTAALRFFLGLGFMGVITLLIRRRWFHGNDGDISRHLFRVDAPWIVAGFALMGASFSASGDFFRFFLASGCCCAIWGEVFLAWDLRLLQYPMDHPMKAPLLRLMPLAMAAYLLLYLPITQPMALLFWTLLIVGDLYFRKKAKITIPAHMQMESGALDFYAIILYTCLFLALSGLQLYSMGLYLAYAALSEATELSLGGMAVVSRINEHLPQEGARAVIARLAVALAAPFVLVIAVAGLCLWIAMLPGGIYLLKEYGLKGISVGATQFNIIQVLLIISAFYLTRTVVAMGTRFLAKLPNQGVYFDTTLITPLQTALTYAAWAFFGLFMLKSLGMELSNLAMVAGGLSVGIGFGAQTIVNNFLSGLILIFGRTLQVGDVVEVGGITGKVRKISVRATMVETYDNAMIYVPNSEFMSGRLINWTSFSRSVRREVAVGVAYGSDTREVIELLVAIAKGHENVLPYPVPTVNFADFGASSLDFRLRFWVKDFELGSRTSSDIRIEIDRIFAEHNIEISFPQLDVHLKDAPPLTIRDNPPPARPGGATAVTRPARKPFFPKRPGTRRGMSGARADSARNNIEGNAD